MAKPKSLITITEAVAQGIASLRRDPWEPSSRLVLHLTQDAGGKWFVGPWARIVSSATEAGVIPEPTQIFLFSLDAAECAWEPWQGTD